MIEALDKSMYLLLKTYPNCQQGYVFLAANFAEQPEQKLTFLLLYYANSLVSEESH
jgi:hypothetical protein